ncbi:MAG: nicotinamide-nucleotide amidohydrolase family protein, partial [Bacteroidales bacterium]|nr:nicotinamide-nucleotide amidohydrolase family protein [Bacteroidales bacterium]
GVGESFLSDIISDWEEKLPDNIKLAYLPQPGLVRLRLSAIGKDKNKLQKQIDNRIVRLNELIHEMIFGYDDDTLEGIIGKLLKEKNKSLSTAESCTGGYIAHLITSIPGSSYYYKGSVIAYSNEIKKDVLGVKNNSLIKYGAVSEQVVTEMVTGIKRKFNTDFAIATSGIAGPDGGTIEKPVGTIWIAVATPEKLIAKKFLFGEHRQRNIRKTALSAMNLLRKGLITE